LAVKLYKANFTDIDKEQIKIIIEKYVKKRFEIKGDNIQAIYGHSIPGKLLKEPTVPPQLLYHGTTIEIADLINNASIKRMQRQYVHLSVDIATAKEVAKKR